MEKFRMWKSKEPKKNENVFSKLPPVPDNLQEQLVLQVPHLLHQQNEINSIYNSLDILLESSAYARITSSGQVQFEKFPKSLKTEADKNAFETAKKDFETYIKKPKNEWRELENIYEFAKALVEYINYYASKPDVTKDDMEFRYTLYHLKPMIENDQNGIFSLNFPERTTESMKLLRLIKETFAARANKKREKALVEEMENTVKQIKTLLSLFESREQFEKRLKSYLEARILFEENVDKAGNIVDMLNLQEVPENEVKPKLKTTTVHCLTEAQKGALKVGETFNLLANYSLNMQPEHPGFYDWFSYKRPGDQRIPWHQRVEMQEAVDIHSKIKQLLSIGKQAVPFGMDVQAINEKIEATIDLMEPAEKHQDNLPVFFSRLWENQKQTLQADEMKTDPSPTSKDLKLVTEGPVKIEVVSTAKEETADEHEESKWFDAITSSPAGSSKKKKLTKKKHRAVMIHSSDSDSSSSNFSSVSSTSINTTCSPEILKKKAEKRIMKARKALKMKLQEEPLRTLKQEVKSIKKKITVYGDEDDEELNFIEEKLEDLILKIDGQLEEKKLTDRRLKQLPRGKLMVWDGSVSQYIDFKTMMKEMLIYDSESLKLSTLKDCIQGKEKAFIAEMLYNVDSLEEAFQVLDTHYGDIRTVMPRLRAKLDKMPSYPENEEVENKNIQALLTYWQTAKKHNVEKSFVDSYFIQEYSDKLSKLNKKLLITMKIEDCSSFIQQIKEFQRTNIIYIRTQKESNKKSYQNMQWSDLQPNQNSQQSGGSGGTPSHHRQTSNQTKNDPSGQGRHYHDSRYNDGYHTQRWNSNRGGKPFYKKQSKCLLCAEPHLTHSCPLITQEMDQKKLKGALNDKGLCVKCLLSKHNGECNDWKKPYMCETHNANKSVCKCGKVQLQNNTSINGGVLGSVGFDTEQITVRNGSRSQQVVLTYDSFASHTTMNRSLVEDLELKPTYVGELLINTYNGRVEEKGFSTRASIDGITKPVDFIISSVTQKIPQFVYQVPQKWMKKYKLPKQPQSISGLNLITVGKDHASLFPQMIDCHNGVCISKSRITGKMIISGRAYSSSSHDQMNNKTVMQADTENIRAPHALQYSPIKDSFCNAQNVDHGVSQNSVRPKQQVPCDEKKILHEISTDSINVPPVKRCGKCLSCKNCKKTHLPDEARQTIQKEIVQQSLSYSQEKGYYTASYPYNRLLSQLQENKEPSLRMMKNLETKLQKEGLIDRFNEAIKDFFNRGVIKWTTDLPGLQDMQKSYIPLTYTLRKDATTKLRVCGNSSFKTGKYVSLNECMIPGPAYLNSIDGILLRWRMADQVAHADVRQCYHKCHSAPKDQSLRRVHLRPGGMGTDEPWKEACFTVVSFGDTLGGATAQLAIADCANRFMTPQAKETLEESIYMDDIMLPSNKRNIKSLVKEVDNGLRKGDFGVKEWTISGQKNKNIKFLSYNYKSEEDKFTVRPKINWSPRKRGVRKAEDVTNMEELSHHIEQYGLTKRSLASVLMGSLHDPLQIMAPYINNIKLIYRDVCRMGLNWDQEVPEEIKTRLLEALSFFFMMENIEFPRKVVFSSAKSIKFMIYFDGAKSAVGVSVIVKSTFLDGTVRYRLLCNKSKLTGSDVNTAPRSELCACLISTRIYSLIKQELKTFLSAYEGTVSFQIIGDSLIVLNQIKKESFAFHTYAAARIQEIRESTMKYKVEWSHCASEQNISDVLTRTFLKPPSELPWSKQNMELTEDFKEMTELPLQVLPDCDKKQVLMANKTQILSEDPDLAIIMLYNELKASAGSKCQDQSNPMHDILSNILQRCSSYQKSKNVVARIIQFKKRNLNMAQLQEEAELKLFSCFQENASAYIHNFRGSGFYTVKRGDIYLVKGRDTENGPTEYKLVPPKTLLFARIAATFHQKHHAYGSPVYIRSRILDSGYYMPHVIKTLKSLQDKCCSCRKRIQKRLETKMGQISKDRIEASSPFSKMQSDLIGPIAVKEFVNQRSSRKVWILTSIDHFSRYITLTVVESLSKESIINALKAHFNRYGKSKTIETDFGTNFVAAKSLLEQENIDVHDVKEIENELKSSGVTLIQRTPKAPFIQGSIEKANALIKRILPYKRMTLFQLLNILEYVMFNINKRPIGLTSTLDQVTPSDIIPVWSNLLPGCMQGCTQVLQDAKQEFEEKWKQLYHTTILRQKKWLESNHELATDDLVLILDLKTSLNYPVAGRIAKVEQDSSGLDRYFWVSYKQGKTCSTVKRPAQSLTLILTKKEQDESKITDSVAFVREDDMMTTEKRQKLKVTIGNVQTSDQIKDL